MANWTPGEWKAWKAPTGEWTVRSRYEDEQGRRCTTWPAICDAGAQDNEANAHLIAAAPELYEALDEFVERYPNNVGAIKARAALAKARGETA